jgi:hypothetical protein
MGVAVDAQYVYWTALTPDLDFCFGGCPSSATVDASAPSAFLRRMPLGGGPVTTIAAEAPQALVARDGSVWGLEPVQLGQVLVRIDADGTRTLLAGGISVAAQIGVDDTSVYWSLGGALLQTAR